MLMAIGAGLTAALAYYLVSPFLSPAVVRYLTFGLTFGAFTFIDQRFIEKSDKALLRTGIVAALTTAIFFVLDQIL